MRATLSPQEGDLSTYLKISALGDIKRVRHEIGLLELLLTSTLRAQLSAKIELVKQGFHGNELIWWDEPLLDVICKFLFTAIYAFGVFALTAVVMTYVHDRIPDPVKCAADAQVFRVATDSSFALFRSAAPGHTAR